MSEHNSMEVGNIGKFPTLSDYLDVHEVRFAGIKRRIVEEFPTMEALVREFDAAANAMDSLPCSAGDEVAMPLNDTLWATREAINEMPARTWHDYELKANVAYIQLARENGEDYDCLGSAKWLFKSLVDDALTIMRCAQAA